MGDISEMMIEDAQIAIMKGISVAQGMTDSEVVQAISEIVENKKDEDGHYVHGYYKSNSYTPMVKDIVDRYRESGSMTPKQRNALDNHYGVYGNVKEGSYGI